MSKYVHYKNGKTYWVVGHAISEGSKEALVLYSEVDGAILWCRRAEEFFGKVYLEDDTQVPRFKEVSDD